MMQLLVPHGFQARKTGGAALPDDGRRVTARGHRAHPRLWTA